MSNEIFIKWARELQSIAQAGLHYSKDKFDIERFERIRDISAEMLSEISNEPIDKIKDIFCCEKGYQTPKVDVRSAIINEGKILLVRENNGLWSMPGGWADVGLSPAENAEKEAFEEAGANVKAERPVAIHDWQKNNGKDFESAVSVYKIFLLCSYIDGKFKENIETIESGWFSFDELPELCSVKNTNEQIKLCFEAYDDINFICRFD
ncbi:MAG: NUDIX hydrolase [Oscillospiraceae bacterium]|nr:NUDIX hydrolase [Oscillospiraceae bacterium]